MNVITFFSALLPSDLSLRILSVEKNSPPPEGSGKVKIMRLGKRQFSFTKVDIIVLRLLFLVL